MKKILHGVVAIVFIPAIIYNLMMIIGSYVNPGAVPKIFGYSAYVVLSGSMENEINIGDLVISNEIEEKEITVGDVISFNDDGSIITHRVVDIVILDNEIKYVTKGDSNNTNDKDLVDYDDVYGRMVMVIPKIGNILLLFQNKLVLMVIFVLFFMICFYDKSGKGSVVNGEEN